MWVGEKVGEAGGVAQSVVVVERRVGVAVVRVVVGGLWLLCGSWGWWR